MESPEKQISKTFVELYYLNWSARKIFVQMFIYLKKRKGITRFFNGIHFVQCFFVYVLFSCIVLFNWIEYRKSFTNSSMHFSIFSLLLMFLITKCKNCKSTHNTRPATETHNHHINEHKYWFSKLLAKLNKKKIKLEANDRILWYIIQVESITMLLFHWIIKILLLFSHYFYCPSIYWFKISQGYNEKKKEENRMTFMLCFKFII